MSIIYESQRINIETGEIINSHTVRVNRNNERFLFARTTQGLEWTKDFKTMQDFRTFLALLEFQEPNSGVSIFTGEQIKECARTFECSEKTIRNSISSLIRTNFIHKISSSNYFTNPYTFYKGGVITLREKMDTWNKFTNKNGSINL